VADGTVGDHAFEVFLRESKWEDFISGDVETILVSTMHKAKGKEFDNVFLMLDNFYLNEESEKRTLYVAMTRAKNNLIIHTNTGNLDGLMADDLQLLTDTTIYDSGESVVLQLTHRDVWLGFFSDQHRQKLIKQLQSGDELRVTGHSCYTSQNREILRFSKSFIAKLEELKTKGYAIETAKINFMLFWKNEETKEENKIILPEIYLKITIDR
jgi:ATP-dependent DNA helicase RecQ